jgi:hypothetical protein
MQILECGFFSGFGRTPINCPIIAKLLNISLYECLFLFKNDTFSPGAPSLSVRNLYYSLVLLMVFEDTGVNRSLGGLNYRL